MKTLKTKSYREFLKTYAAQNGYEDFSEKRKEAQRTFDRAESTYGIQAEALAMAGLQKSGYASYLNERAKENYKKQKNQIAMEEATEENKRFSSYEKYLDDIRKQSITAKGQIHRSILSSKTTNLEHAMRIARIYGLSDEDARETAESAVEVNILSRKQEILERIRTERISAERAVYYGKTYGLPEDVIEELRRFAEELYGEHAGNLSYDDYKPAN